MTINDMAEKIYIQAMGQYLAQNGPMIENIKGLGAIVAVKAISCAEAFTIASSALEDGAPETEEEDTQ